MTALLVPSRVMVLVSLGCCAVVAGCAETRGKNLAAENLAAENLETSPMSTDEAASELATFGAGCFWCVEAVYQELEGVESVTSGYAGGTLPNPTYDAVCSGLTGHAEVCQIRFDPAKVRYDELLAVFWKTHDPTTLNRQGPDSGTQYRSVIFYHNDDQRLLAEKYKKELDESGAWQDPMVTEISPLEAFYGAEQSHQNFFKSNPRYPYCQRIIAPKMDKFRQVFSDKLKQSGGR